MISKNDLLEILKDKTVTLGWDAVAVYERDHVNMVMEQQYVNKVAEGTHFPPISKRLEDVGNSQTIILDSLLIGTPLISFEEANIESSYVKVRLELVSGIVTILDKEGINRIDDVNTVNGYALELKVALENISGSVDDEGQVIIDFSKSTLLDVSFPGMTLPGVVIELFRDFLKNNPVSYVINTIDVRGANILTPQKFIVRTQVAPGAMHRESVNYGNGAVIIFIATKANPSGGFFPSNSYPWLLPQEHSVVLILSSKVLFKDLIKPNVDSVFDKGVFSLEFVDESVGDSAYCLRAKTTNIIDEPLIFNYEGKEVWTGSVYIPTATRTYKNIDLPFKEVLVKANGIGVNIKLDSDGLFKADFGLNNYHCVSTPVGTTICGDHFYNETYDFYISGEISHRVGKNNNGNITLSKTDGLISVIGDYEPPTWWSGRWEKDISDKFSSVANDKLGRINSIDMPEIDVSLIQHIIFPDEVELTYFDIYIPGDMVLFGELAPKSTAFRIHPLRSVVGLNDTRQFSVSPRRSVDWKISPPYGSINRVTGLYTAPAGTLKEDKTITVSATDTTGAVSAASVVLTESAVTLAPTFITIAEKKNEPVDFSWFATDDSKVTVWSLESSLPDTDRGSINAEGRYTAPKKIIDGAHIVNVNAENEEGKVAKAYVRLKNNMTKDEVVFEPYIHQQVRSEETVDFIVTTGDLEVTGWQFYPENVGEWQWEKIDNNSEDEFIYRVQYTAPKNITQRCMVFALARISAKRVGVGSVMLVPGANNWDLITSIEELSISLPSGEDKATIFANGRNQIPVSIHIKGLNSNNNDQEVPLSLGDIISHLELVDYTTGEPLRHEEARGWFYSQTKNEFQTLPESYSSSLRGNNLLYVMCDSQETIRSKRIALRVKLTSPDAEQKIYWTGANAGSLDSSVVVNAQEQIDYSKSDNLIIMNTELQSTSQALKWGYKRGRYYADKNNGSYFKKRVDIKPSSVSHFHSVEIERQDKWNADLNPELIRWKGNTVHSFSAINSSGAAPAAVYATNKLIQVGEDEYTELNLWYIQRQQPTDVYIKGEAYFLNMDSDDPEYYGQCMQPDFLDKAGLAETQDMASFYLYKLRLGVREGDDENSQSQININGTPDHWKQSMPELSVSVVDIYGNSGVFTIYWNNVNDNSNDADKLLIR